MSNAVVDKLNGLLKGEMSAVETYRQALEKVETPEIKEQLKECHMCHSGRVDAITKEVVERGGKPAENSGAWGAFAKMMEGSATAFGEKAAIGILEEGEDKGLDDYRLLIKENPEINSFLNGLYQAQEGTHSKMRALKKSL